LACPGRRRTVLEVEVVCLSDPSVAPEQRRLWLEAADASGVTLREVLAHRLALRVVPNHHPEVLLDGEPFWPSLVLLRSVVPFLSTLELVVPLWQARGATVLNPPAVLRTARDKLASALALADAGVPTPPTVGISHRSALASPSFTNVLPAGTVDVVVKPAVGSRGTNVRCYPGLTHAHDALDDNALGREDRLVVQPRLGPYGQDIRAMVVGDTCVAAMRRRSQAGFAANASLGATVEPCEPTPLLAATAVAAVRALGLDYAGVDLLETDPPMVLEANALPGIAHITAVTGVNPVRDILALLRVRAVEVSS
jgi:ribosomal protein S6--L-glutamate ligase